MVKSRIEMEIERLQSLSLEKLREEWRRLHQTPPPKRLSRDLMMRGIAYKHQEKAFRGLSKTTMRMLQGSNSGGPKKQMRHSESISYKPGTRLVREWRGKTHTVVVLDRGVEWQGRHYRSLSIVAREITGAHWSGPRFFGLTADASDD